MPHERCGSGGRAPNLYFKGKHVHQAAYFFRTPSSEMPSPHFIFDTLRRSSLGTTPCVIGVANSAARYREDRSVRIHDTPFEQRCAGGPDKGFRVKRCGLLWGRQALPVPHAGGT